MVHRTLGPTAPGSRLPVRTVALAARGQTSHGIRAALHPRWIAALRVALRASSAAIRPSSRLASPALRRSRCSREIIHGLLAVPIILATAANPTPVSAQEVGADTDVHAPARPWQLGIWARTGIIQPVGRFATYPLPGVFANLLDVRTELKSARTHSVGMALRFPTRGFEIRAGWETTTGGKATGFLAVCQLVKCTPETVSATVTEITVEARSSLAGADRRFAPLLALGTGRRWYHFGETDCSVLENDERPICDAIAEIFQSPGSHAVIRASAGVAAYLRFIRADLAASATFGRYSGGDGATQGKLSPDIRLSVGVAVDLL